ncbi:uncharacterized protein AC631_01464 [Debaryomyces fabryi]|uniref:Uncharacterized protein n=1 Tax=Debaryomyces fabryi TaxID=58627 RepID=A0A0V1Q2L2_9ASCO|nr:uncharacterized protein AC631_01464 [Debaryomyces fabryi]KSA02760.1 hypothetical protein AC631_01464 [Debaryomyces fabryi]
MSPFLNEEAIEKDSDLTDQLLLVPRNLLKSGILTKLGLEYLNQDSHLFNLTHKYQNIVIPKDSKNLFIFNTTDNLSIPRRAQNRFVELIQRSAPFNLPQYMKLVNFYAVIPREYMASHYNSSKNNLESVLSNGILEVPASKLPIFRRCISENKPLMVFLFNSGKSDDFKASSGTIMNIKNYITRNRQKASVSTFFDSFAYNWIDKINYSSLIQSVFCTTNNKNMDESYCLKVQDKQTIHLFPAFYDIAKRSRTRHHLVDLHLRQDEQDLPEHLNANQAIKEAGDILYSAAQLINGTVYKFAGERFSNAERFNIDAKSKIHKIQDKLGEIPEILGDIKDTLDDPDQSPIINNYDGLKKIFQLDNGENDEVVHESSFPSSRRRKARLARGLEQLANRGHQKPDGGFLFPASLIKFADSIKTAPRKKWYSQVIYSPFKIDDNLGDESYNETEDIDNDILHKRLSIFSNDENCDKITWYNIFHYSIFGKPHFCLD